ncbi:MAG: cupin domain-containing protein [Gammaproteobacteria bacterium]|nr:cupin domain-containing protein [Gammaproteobacteria bacterium]MDX2459637.1 cupin domain-containing protein [Gammaproteobacteria bacterium]
MQYVEIYADDEGVSHFRDVAIELAKGEVAPPVLPVELSPFRAATEVGFIAIPSGWVGGWHQPPTEGYIFVLSGEIQIEVGDGEVRRFPQGSVWLHKDRNGPGHNSSVVSSKDAKLVMVKFPEE